MGPSLNCTWVNSVMPIGQSLLIIYKQIQMRKQRDCLPPNYFKRNRSNQFHLAVKRQPPSTAIILILYSYSSPLKLPSWSIYVVEFSNCFMCDYFVHSNWSTNTDLLMATSYPEEGTLDLGRGVKWYATDEVMGYYEISDSSKKDSDNKGRCRGNLLWSWWWWW